MIIMSAIWKVGKGEMQLDELVERLISPDDFPKIPPASPNGLVLWETVLDQ
jgi:tRNA pseudouridine38-40 synthase